MGWLDASSIWYMLLCIMLAAVVVDAKSIMRYNETYVGCFIIGAIWARDKKIRQAGQLYLVIGAEVAARDEMVVPMLP